MPLAALNRARRVTILRVVGVLAGLVAAVFGIGAVRHPLVMVTYFPAAWVIRWTGSRYGTGDAFYRVAGLWWIAGGLVGIGSTLAFPLSDTGSISGSALIDGLVFFGCAMLIGAILFSLRAADMERRDEPTTIFTAH